MYNHVQIIFLKMYRTISHPDIPGSGGCMNVSSPLACACAIFLDIFCAPSFRSDGTLLCSSFDF